MLSVIGAYIWHSLIGWVGITAVIMAAAIALYIWVATVTVYLPILAPLTVQIRHCCVGIAVVCACVLFMYPKAYLDGVRYEKNQWAIAEQKARAAGDAARADALRDVANGVRDPFDSDGD